MYRRILVPLDGTRFGDHALPWAVDLAQRTGASLELLHVHHHTDPEGRLTAMPQYGYENISRAELELEEEALLRERQELEQRAADMELRYNVQVRTRVVTGRTDDAIVQEALEIVADLVVMATHARLGWSRLRYGSIAHELVTHLNVPALCVRPQGDETPLVAPRLRRFLVTLDGSWFSEQVLDAVVPLLQQLDAQPTLLHIVSPRYLTTSSGGERMITTRDDALAYLHGVADRLRGHMPEPVLAAVEASEPAATIAGLLGAGEFDAVAMATHGRSGLSRVVMGSIAETVLHNTDRPVLLYRPRLARMPASDVGEEFRVYGE